MTIRVVLADDHRMLRDALVEVLGRVEDIDIVGVADDGAGALLVAREYSPDVLVLDIAMPGINGVEVTRCLRAELPQVRILMLSAYTDKSFISVARSRP